MAPTRFAVAMLAGLLLTLSAAACTDSAPTSQGREEEGASPSNEGPPVPDPTATEALEAPLPSDAILYGLGLSTDPYGRSQPRGIGVVSIVGSALSRSVEISQHRLQPDFWIDQGRMVAAAPGRKGMRKNLIVEFHSGRLTKPRKLAVPTPVWDVAVSPDGTKIAYEPIKERKNGYTSGNRVIVQRFDGAERRVVAQGSLAGWTPTGEVLFWDDPSQSGTLMTLDPRTDVKTLLFSGSEVAAAARRAGPTEVGDPVYSADGEYMAAVASVRWQRGNRNLFTIVILNGDGKVVRFVTSRFAISMFAWSPTGHRLAYTTSGFPNPHQLFVLRSPNAEEVKLFSKREHFDWVTWSPKSERLLLDDEQEDRWLLMRADGRGRRISFPRLGGRPMWCCPLSNFGGI